jgi:hypothetical protein
LLAGEHGLDGRERQGLSHGGHADERHRAFGASHVEGLFGYPPVLAAATGLTEDNEVADWAADVQRYVDAYAGTAGA